MLIFNRYLKEFVTRMRDGKKYMEQAKGNKPREAKFEGGEPYSSNKGTYAGMIAALARRSKKSIKAYWRNITFGNEVNMVN